MKKLSYLLGLFAITGIIFTSCSKDEDDPKPPTVSFLGGTDPGTGWVRVDGDITMEVGEPFVFGFTATSQSDKNLSRILVVRDYENVSVNTVLDSTISATSFTIDIETVAFPNNPGSEVFTVTATDKNGLSTSISFTVTTEAGDPGISVYTNISLGSYTSTTNSSFASITGETYQVLDIEIGDVDTQKLIDIVYLHGNNYGHTLAAPGSNVAAQVYSSTIGEWEDENRNNTVFGKTSLTVNDYNNVVDDNSLSAVIYNSGVLPMTIKYFSELLPAPPQGFEVDDIIAFTTKNGKQGLIRITEIIPGSDNGKSTITYDVKVKK